MGSLLSVLLATTAAVYTAAAVLHVFSLFRRHFELMARWATRASWAVHSAGLIMLIAQIGRMPIGSLFEFSFLLTWTMLTIYLVLELLRDSQAAATLLLPIITVIQVIGVALPKPSESMVDEFPASLVGWHIGVTMMGYGFLVGSFVAGTLYLLQERNLRLKRFGPLYHRLPSLETLDIWSGRFVYIGFPMLTIGVWAGLVFAHVQWARLWQADPKVIFTLLVWLVYGGYLLMRKVWGWGGRKAAWWSVAGVTGLLINYFVMNVLSRLHRFGV